MTTLSSLARAGAGALALAIAAAPAAAQNRIDLVRPDAPELAAHGDFAVGVRSTTLTNPGQLDIVNVADGARPTYDRELTVEIWHPAETGGAAPSPIEVVLRDGETTFEILGAAVRDAAPDMSGAPYPLVIVSHGYPGNRFLMSHLAENLASKGYVAVSIDHRDSTYSDQAAFGSTLVNRPLDQMFVLQQMAEMSAEGGALAGLIDTDNTGLIGYSMGGYGAVISSGGGLSETGITLPWGAPERLAEIHAAGAESHEALIDDRLKAVIAIGPWGRELAHYGTEGGFWDADGLAGVRKPILYIAGSDDTISIYETGVRRMYEESVNAPWRGLLTFENAGHNAAAPMPAPAESWAVSEKLGWAPWGHYGDAVWDTLKMNNIAQHFATAYFDLLLKGDESKAAYLDLVESGGDAVYAVKDGEEQDGHTYWKGFGEGAAQGLTWTSATSP